ncbi:MAG: U32 family peptidase [Candidatus Omnitrophica bacterium]|nr:U32 family peptidase [Candidatus Omnitrophota bacterium]
MLKIVSPVTSCSEVKAVIKAGADEIYCGVMPFDLLRKYGFASCLNRRPNLFSNLHGYNELEELVNLAHAENVPVGLTINEFYPQTQIELAWEQFERGLGCGVDAFIVSDIGLLCRIIKEKQKNDHFKVHISNCGTTFNSGTAEFYRGLGASRIILPRDLSIGEVVDLAGLLPAEMETEAFILNQRCHNIDGFCTFQHGILPGRKIVPVGALGSFVAGMMPAWLLRSAQRSAVENGLACCLDYEIKSVDGSVDIKTVNSYYENRARSFLDSCGACAIYDLNTAGIKFLKIVGRCLASDKIRDIRFIRACVGLLDSVVVRSEFGQAVQMLRKKFFGSEKGCGREYCYY